MLRVNQNLVLIIGCAVIGCAATWLALTIDSHVRGWAFAMPGTTDATMAPSTFPRMILGLVAALSFANAAANISPLLRAPDHAGLDVPRLAAIILAVLAGFAALANLGFILTALLVTTLAPWALGYRNLPAIGLTAFLIAGVAWALFRYGMNVILPQFTLF